MPSNDMGVRRLLSVPIAFALLAAPATAGAPNPVMQASGGRQQGGLAYRTDVSPDGRGCVLGHGDGTGQYPEPVRHDGSSLTWRVDDARRPASVTLVRYAADDYVRVGPPPPPEPVPVPFTLEPVRRGSRTVAWTVRSGAVGYGDLRFGLTVVWPRERCGQDEMSYRYRALSLPV